MSLPTNLEASDSPRVTSPPLWRCCPRIASCEKERGQRVKATYFPVTEYFAHAAAPMAPASSWSLAATILKDRR